MLSILSMLLLLIVGFTVSVGAAGVGIMHWNRDRHAAIMLMIFPFFYAILFALIFFINNAYIKKMVVNFNSDIIENVKSDKIISKLDFKEIRISESERKIELKEEGSLLCDYFAKEGNTKDIYETRDKHIKYKIRNITINENKGCSKNNTANNIQYTLSRV